LALEQVFYIILESTNNNLGSFGAIHSWMWGGIIGVWGVIGGVFREVGGIWGVIGGIWGVIGGVFREVGGIWIVVENMWGAMAEYFWPARGSRVVETMASDSPPPYSVSFYFALSPYDILIPPHLFQEVPLISAQCRLSLKAETTSMV
jgi:hypothetical protein